MGYGWEDGQDEEDEDKQSSEDKDKQSSADEDKQDWEDEQSNSDEKKAPPARTSKKPMPNPGQSGEAPTLGHLLTAGRSYSVPIDVEAVDKLMQNFSIMEEHQVHCSGVDSLKLCSS